MKCPSGHGKDCPTESACHWTGCKFQTDDLGNTALGAPDLPVVMFGEPMGWSPDTIIGAITIACLFAAGIIVWFAS